MNAAVPMPTNVRLETDHGPISLELVYEGVGSDGRHVWTNPTPVYVRGKSAQLRFDGRPEEVAIAVRFGMEGFEPMPGWGAR